MTTSCCHPTFLLCFIHLDTWPLPASLLLLHSLEPHPTRTRLMRGWPEKVIVVPNFLHILFLVHHVLVHHCIQPGEFVRLRHHRPVVVHGLVLSGTRASVVDRPPQHLQVVVAQAAVESKV